MNPSLNRRCVMCRGPIERLCAAYCARCRPLGGALPIAVVVERAQAARAAGLTADETAADLGTTAAVLERRLHRHQARELARWFGAARRRALGCVQRAA